MRLVSIVALGVLVSGAALANDSTATVGAGGLVLEKTDAIAMVSEDLYVSVDVINVDYRFRNITAVPVSTVVAFPMPPRRLADEYGSDVAFPSSFRTTVDGQPVPMALERKAMVGDIDYRARLEALRVPVAPDRINQATAAMDGLDPARKRELIRLGLAGEEEWDDDGKGMRKHLVPLWTVEDRYWWKQKFAPGRDVRIHHRYVPGAGGSAESVISFKQFRETDDTRAMIRTYCIDEAFIAAVDSHRRSAGPNAPGLSDRRIDYILTTGANWARPIGEFRLIVDKQRAANLVSFCGDGVTKISPTQFEMRKRNWRPSGDLHVLILEPRGAS